MPPKAKRASSGLEPKEEAPEDTDQVMHDEEDEDETQIAVAHGDTPVLGRTKSRLHSARVREGFMRGTIKPTSALVVYAVGDFVALRSGDDEGFSLARVAEPPADADPEDVGKKLYINHLDVLKKEYVVGAADTVSVREAVLCKVEMGKVSQTKFRLPATEKRKILKAISDTTVATVDDDDDGDDAMDDDGEPKKKKAAPKRRTVKAKKAGKGKAKAEAEAYEEEEGDEPAPKKRAAKKRKQPDNDDDDDEPAAKRRKKAPAKRRTTGPVHGVANDEIKPILIDPTFFSPDAPINTSCCGVCASREVLRAVYLKDKDLLAKALKCEKAWTAFIPRSAGSSEYAISVAVATSNLDAVKLILEEDKKPSNHDPPATSSLTSMGTGNYNAYTYGHRVRKLAAGRGGKEGNNAFVEDVEYQGQFAVGCLDVSELVQKAFASGVSVETFNALTQAIESFDDYVSQHVIDVILAGNLPLAHHVVKSLATKGGFGFNMLHHQALATDGKDFDKFKSISVKKKAIGNDAVTPVHCAAINTDAKYLKALLEVVPEYTLQDFRGRTPMHYAAVSSGTATIDFLLSKGVDYGVTDGRPGQTPLMYAARAGRIGALKALLAAAEKIEGKKGQDDEGEGDDGEDDDAEHGKPQAKYIDRADATGYTALHHAAENGRTELVKELIARGANVEAMIKTKKSTALVLAATNGHLESVRALVEEGNANIAAGDKNKKSPLIFAALHGHLPVLSYLVHMGGDANGADNSGNTVLHYACAYGWLHSVQFLVKYGAAPEAPNQWKLTPMGVAMLKGHFAIAEFLFSQDKVDVNVRNDEGRTLVSQAVTNLTEASVHQLNFLISKKNADVNITNNIGESALHYLATCDLAEDQRNQGDDEDEDEGSDDDGEGGSDEDAEMKDEDDGEGDDAMDQDEATTTTTTGKKESKKKEKPRKRTKVEILTDIANLLLEAGAKTDFVSENGETALDVAVLHQNWTLARILLEKQPNLKLAADSEYKHYENQNILHVLAPRLLRIRAKDPLSAGLTPVSLFKLLAACPDFTELGKADQVDHRGMTPIHALLEAYVRYTAPKRAHSNTVEEGADKEARQQFTEFLDLFLGTFGAGAADVLLQQVTKKPKIVKPRKSSNGEAEEGDNDEEEDEDDEEDEDEDKKKKAKEEEENPEEGYTTTIGRWTALHFVAFFNSLPEATAGVLKVLFKHANGAANIAKMLAAADVNENSPISVAVAQASNEVLGLLLEAHPAAAVLNKKNSCGLTPLLIAATQNNQVAVEKLVAQAGIDLNVTDSKGNTALHLLAAAQSTRGVSALLAHKANPNLVNQHKRAPLHLTVAASSCSSDVNFTIEEQLIKAGARVDLADVNGRTPVFYCFAPLKDKSTDTSKLDPIDSLTALLVLAPANQLNLNARDSHKRTPLHYASRRGSTICALKMIGEKADINATDEIGNTPLAEGLLAGHVDYSILLLQKGADCTTQLATVVEKADEQEEDEDGNNKLNKWGHRRAKKGRYGHNYGKSPKKPRRYGGHNQNQQSQFHVEQLDAIAFDEPMLVQKHLREKKDKKDKKEKKKDVKTETKTMSSFMKAISENWNGVASLLLDMKFDYTVAIRNAIDLSKFGLVSSLLAKTKPEVIRALNPEKQNLFHAVANLHLATSDPENPTVVAALGLLEKLLSLGLDPNLADASGTTPLILASVLTSLPVVKFFIAHGGDVNLTSKKALNPIGAAMCGDFDFSTTKSDEDRDEDEDEDSDEDEEEKGKDAQSESLDETEKSLLGTLTALFEAKANPNVLYADTAYVKDDKPTEGKTTPLIKAVRFRSKKAVKLLLANNADVNLADEAGRTAIMHCVITNDMAMAKLLLKTKKVDLNKQDAKRGFTAVHFVVEPTEFGSYENVEFLKLLVSNGAKVDIQDIKKHTPQYYAAMQDSGRMAEALEQFTKKPTWAAAPQRLQSIINEWPEEPNVDGDVAEVKKNLEKKSAKKEVTGDDLHVVDKVSGMEKKGNVHADGNVYYDLIMTKVDVAHGSYGVNNFYRMQVIHDKQKDLYILWNRWGRCGSGDGQFQRTPFPSADEATAEFEKIFKAKTGFKWDQYEDSLKKKQPKKWRVMKIEKSTPDATKILNKAWDLADLPASNLPKDLLILMQSLSDVTMLKKSLRQVGVDTDILPLHKITEELVLKAKKVLEDLSTYVSQVDADMKAGVIVDNLLRFEKIAALSNSFYEIIPHRNFGYDKIIPLSSEDKVNEKLSMLESLTDISMASKILIGATHSLTRTNPFDYVHQALQVKLDLLDHSGSEYKTLLQYINNTRGDHSAPNVTSLWRLQRRDEAERIAKWKQTKKHVLLFHGSSTSNFIGILSQGLRVAPAEASSTGARFGRGIYFSDTYEKSAYYINSDGSQYEYMLMCEVVLGNQLEISEDGELPDGFERLPDDKNSVWAKASKGPDHSKNIILPNGVEVPVSPVVELDKVASKKKGGKQKRNYRYNSIQHNEFIVFDESQVRMRYLIQIKTGQ